MKTYVLDTNVLLHNPQALFAFQENKVVLPLAVIEEMDELKRRQDEIGRNARTVSRSLDGFREEGPLSQGVTLPAGGSIRIEVNHTEPAEGFPDILNPDKADNRILGVAWNLAHDNGGGPVILVSKDLNLRLKADVLGIPAQDFQNDKVDFDSLYTGAREVALGAGEIDSFYQVGMLRLGKRRRAFPHQFFVLKCKENPSLSALGRWYDGLLTPLVHAEGECMGVKPRNKEQRFALELLLNDEVKVVSLAGSAGTGKTLLALAAGLEKVLEQKVFHKLLVTRPVVPMGQDLGYLPGEKEDKLRPWMQPIHDNLAYLFREYPVPGGGRGSKGFGPEEYLLSQGMLEMEALTYLRGRSIPRQFIICDEAQNLTPQMVKTLVTRVGEGSKIVFTGDPEQIDHPYLDAASNGLTVLVERMKAEPIAGHVSLFKGERSAVAELGARVL
jgi:PhoH-like ATPase